VRKETVIFVQYGIARCFGKDICWVGFIVVYIIRSFEGGSLVSCSYRRIFLATLRKGTRSAFWCCW
jgi:hypothetical protein